MPHDNSDPPARGSWAEIARAPGDSRNANDGFGIFAVHAVLLRTGKVLLWSGRAEGSQYLYQSATWDPQGGASARQYFNGTAPPSPPPTWTAGSNIDLFCAHHVQLADGRVLVVGGAGSGQEGDANGARGIFIFDPATERWSEVAQLARGRWYPTAVLLQDGRVLVVSGRPATGVPGVAVQRHEILSPPDFQPRDVTGADVELSTYPDLHMVTGGRIFYAGCAWTYERPADPRLTAYFRMRGETAADFVELPGAVPVQRNREEGTSVLLPPAQAGRILVIGGARWIPPPPPAPREGGALAPGVDPRSWEILATQGAQPQWVASGQMRRARINVHGVLLPDGKVLIVGGHDNYKRNHTEAGMALTAEIFDPEVALSGTGDPITETAAMHRGRLYHSVALLLPDGRVWLAGGEDVQHAAPTPPPPSGTEPSPGNQKNYEIYSPPYLFRGQQPTIPELMFDEGPAGEISYSGRLKIRFTVASGATIAKVALIRPGATTHHTDSEQRYVALTTFSVSGDVIIANVVSDPTVAPPGYYMVWIVDNQGRPCVQAPFVRLGFRGCDLVSDRSSFSKAEVDSARGGAAQYTFDAAFYVHVTGHTASELGITSLNPTPVQFSGFAPPITITRSSNQSVVPSTLVEAVPQRLLPENRSLPLGARQRFVFQYGLTFKQLDGTSIFSELGPGDPPPPFFLDLKAVAGGYSCLSSVKIFDAPNPFMIDGPVPWLSTDVRVFRLHPGESRLGATLLESDPYSYIRGAIANLTAGTAAFESVSEDQSASELSLARSDAGGRVFNFAVARVRYRGDEDATNVRVFFRMFRWQSTALEFSTTAYPAHQAGSRIVPLLGFDSNIGEIVSIPFFATARQPNMADQADPPNGLSATASEQRTIRGTGNIESAYYGCWLDFNQNDAHFPERPVGTGPFTNRVPINTLIRGHQCLVAEIRYDLDPTDAGDTPADSDNLAQRNLALEQSDNPSPDAHTVQTTFDLKMSEDIGGEEIEGPAAALLSEFPEGGYRPFDELMLVLLDLPAGSTAELLLPDLDIDEIIALASLRGGPVTLEKIDDQTLRCQTGGVVHVPLNAAPGAHVAGLLTITLPDGISVGQAYRVTAHQITRRHGRVEGSFELFIPVAATSALVEREVRRLSFLRYLSAAIPATDRWRGVFDRSLVQVADKVQALGVDPATISPSPDGDAGKIEWKIGVAYGVGDEATFMGLDYRCRQAHTSQSGWEPPNTYALWARINAGTVWAAQVIYQAGDQALFAGQSYTAIQGHQSQLGWEPPNVTALWQRTGTEISGLIVNDTNAGGDGIANNTQWSIRSNFQAGVTTFGDRTYTVDSVGNSVLLGKPWIRTAGDSKNYNGAAPLATFVVTGSFVYLLVDNRHNAANGRPAWLTDPAYVDQGYDVIIRQSSTATFPYSVWRKAVTPGSTVTLPTINSSTAPCYLVVVEPTAPAISSLVVNDTTTGGDGIANNTQWSVQSNFQAGVKTFGDRTYTLESVGNSVLLGKPWIRTAGDSKNYNGAPPLATFVVTGSFVYLLIDNRHNGTSGRPAWLTDSGYVDQGYDVVVRQSSTATYPYSVWRKPVSPGSTVALPIINSTTAPCYFVIVG